MAIRYTSDASAHPPRLRVYINTLALDAVDLDKIAAAGYDGVQFADAPPNDATARACRERGLGLSATARINQPHEAAETARRYAEAGMECATVHAGWGMESDAEACALIEAILAVSEQYIPLYPETHRATIFQDMWRTVEFVRRYPDLRFNGDFSHWYTGLEMVYGGFENKLAFIEPVLERVAFMHGRIGNPGCIQVDIGDGRDEVRHPYIAHFRAMWAAAMRGWMRRAKPGDYLCFTPELLAADIYYARSFNGKEESDRWEQMLVLARIARECFAGTAR